MGNYHSQPSRISERSADPAPIELSSRLIGAGQGISTSVEMPLQINPFYAKQTQFPKKSNDVNPYNTTDYERKRDWTLSENKPNSNPIKPNLKRAKMNVNLYVIEDYIKKDDFSVRINKPNFQDAKMNLELIRKSEHTHLLDVLYFFRRI